MAEFNTITPTMIANAQAVAAGSGLPTSNPQAETEALKQANGGVLPSDKMKADLPPTAKPEQIGRHTAVFVDYQGGTNNAKISVAMDDPHATLEVSQGLFVIRDRDGSNILPLPQGVGYMEVNMYLPDKGATVDVKELKPSMGSAANADPRFVMTPVTGALKLSISPRTAGLSVIDRREPDTKRPLEDQGVTVAGPTEAIGQMSFGYNPNPDAETLPSVGRTYSKEDGQNFAPTLNVTAAALTLRAETNVDGIMLTEKMSIKRQPEMAQPEPRKELTKQLREMAHGLDDKTLKIASSGITRY